MEMIIECRKTVLVPLSWLEGLGELIPPRAAVELMSHDAKGGRVSLPRETYRALKAGREIGSNGKPRSRKEVTGSKPKAKVRAR